MGIKTRTSGIMIPAWVLPAGGGGFSPLNLSGLIGWWKADAGVFSDAGVTPANNGDNVTQWNDQSGNGNHLSTSGGSKPVYNTNQLNGLPAITAIPAGTNFFRSSVVTLGGTTASVFMVAKVTVDIGNGRLFSINAAAGLDTDANAFTVVEETLILFGTYNNGFVGTVAPVSGSWNEIGSIFDGVNNTMYLNNVAGTPVGSTPTFAASVQLGVFGKSDGGTGEGPEGQIAEVVYTSSPLGESDRSSLNTYFLGRWGV